jgi:hypothetical protein
VSAVNAVTVKKDWQRPTVAASVSGTAGPAEVTLSATDDVSGIDQIMYRLDGGEWRTYRTPIKVRGQGVHELAYRAVDKAGNVSLTGTKEIRIG